ncbi:hypothetical protein Agub_g2952 [Astrephomene gubernaculifera]|uniref:Uncharacterized protein n=1 Tax=Astrephomene gubernaculifera TaxID=47775 RepID=A0AAD3HI25_9CHLO|nr:hypothetical protein Agub_g2952 [Astrephomene gubernaculifera]
MQTAINRGNQGLRPLSDRRAVAHAPAFGSATCRRSSVQVFAKGKGKGKTAFRQGTGMPGQMESIQREMPVPEVDPENAEFVMFFRCLKYKNPTVNVMVGPSPWIPVTIMKGSNALNFVTKAVENEWGMKLYGRTLVWQIAKSIYQERAKLEKDVRKRMPNFANVPSSDFEYAFKIRDKANPKDWVKAEGLTVLPPEEELGATGFDQLKAFFSLENLASIFKTPEQPPQQQQ